METHEVHFRITGAFITEQARSFWNAEGEEDRAIRFLTESLPGLTDAQAIEICTGKAKLTGENNEVFLKTDNATHDQYGNPLRSLADSIARRKQEIAELKDDLSVATGNGVYRGSPWGLIPLPPRINAAIRRGEIGWDHPYFQKRKILLESYRERNRQAGVFDRKYHKCTKCGGTGQITAMVGFKDQKHMIECPECRGFGNVRDSIDSQKKAKKTETEPEPGTIPDFDDEAVTPPPPPQPDPTLSVLNAWIDPKGTFYPCPAYGKHQEIAAAFGDKTSLQLEKEGWIKIQNSKEGWGAEGLSFEDVVWDIDYQPTQAQIDTVFGWCQKHNRKFPNRILAKEE